MEEIIRVPLPCSAVQCEQLIQRSAHDGHWHDAKVYISEDGKHLVLGYPTDAAKK